MPRTIIPDSYYYDVYDGDYRIVEKWEIVSQSRGWVEVCLTELRHYWRGDGDYPEETEKWSVNEDGEPCKIVPITSGERYKARILKEYEERGDRWQSANLFQDGKKKKLVRYNGFYD
jgi:hypothetical protein